jgi:hypothetical protein
MGMLWRRTTFALALAFGLATSQAPEFAQQYFQRLGGAIDELKRQMASFDSDSQGVGFSRAEGVEHLRASGDPLARQRGDRVAEDAGRLADLQRQQQEMRGGAPLTKVWVALTRPDIRVAQGAYQDFEPALPMTAGGALCAAGGFFGALALLRWPGALFRRREKKGLAKPGRIY